ncbi:unnamed protein product [Brassica rapa]|uniref:Uncharacterized protein n=1 Tax=Brassica campestris TaxID=3711 RepID=A0A8D9FZY1_BRACM|nr:unnamed protein product [Brassica rapa]
MCTDGQPQTSSTNVLCVLTNTHGRPVCADGHPRPSCTTWAKITRTVHGKGQHAESKDQCADMCTDGQPQTSCTHTDVLCVLTDTHGRPPTWAKITRTVHGKGQRAESKDQHADMCTYGQYPVCADGHTRTALGVLCVLTDTHGCPPTWAKITRTVHGKGQRADTRTVHGKGQHAESKDQHADMCTDGQPRTSCAC